MSDDLGRLVWAIMDEAARTTEKTRLGVIRSLLARSSINGDLYARLLGLSRAAPFIAKPVLLLKVRQRLDSLNRNRGFDFTDKQAVSITNWVMNNDDLLRRILRRKGKPDPVNTNNAGNITQAQWQSMWSLVTPRQALKFAGL